MKKKSNSIKVFSNCFLFTIYIVLVVFTLLSKNTVEELTTFSMNGVNSISSTELGKHYIEPSSEEKVKKTLSYRLTSFYTNDEYQTGSCTGSRWCTKHFQTNEKGWYTYQGKLVLAAATPYLQKKFGTIKGKTYFRYYDEVILTIDGVKYPGIILDTCGACYRDDRIDLFVKDKKSVIDRGYRGRNKVIIEVLKK